MPSVIGFDESVRPKCTCRGCGAIVRHMKTEVQTINGTVVSGGPDGRDYITRPNLVIESRCEAGKTKT